MGLIGLAHGCSHFFQLVLPPLFPFMIRDFGVGYTELGVMMTVFFVSSGFSQPVAGFLVDRVGARTLLFGGLALYSSAILLTSVLPYFWLYLPVMVLVGLGNSVFHPADFTILNASISPARVGRSFGMHTLGGNLGWAAAPVLMLLLASLWGWRTAVFGAGLAGLAVLALLLWNRNALREDAGEHDVAASTEAVASPTPAGLRPILSLPIFLCFLYFVLLAIAIVGVQNFLPVTLNVLHRTPLALAGTALSGFLLGASAGVVVGGILADRSSRYAVVIVAGLCGSALLFVVVGSFSLPGTALVMVVAAAGFLSGTTTPSRDMLVRSATPKGATGRVYGFVYSGLDAGAALAPLTIGIMLDRGEPRLVLWLVSIALFLAVFTALSVRAPAQPKVFPSR